MYPRNAATPERIAIGAVVQISDGAVQSSGVTITVRGQGGAEGAGGGTTAYGASGVVYYTPTQAETDFTSFVVIASKTGCIPVAQTIVPTATATPGYVVAANLDVAVSTRLANADYTAPDNATITLIAAYTDSIESRIPAALVGGRMDSSVGELAANSITASSIAADAIAEIQSGLATLASIAALNNITVADILAGAAIDPIAADVKKINAAAVVGTGVSGDLWRG